MLTGQYPYKRPHHERGRHQGDERPASSSFLLPLYSRCIDSMLGEKLQANQRSPSRGGAEASRGRPAATSEAANDTS
eukprot:13876_4